MCVSRGVHVRECLCVRVCVCVCARVWAVYARLLVVGRGNIVTEEEDKLRCCGSFQKPSSVRRPTNRDANLTRVY